MRCVRTRTPQSYLVYGTSLCIRFSDIAAAWEIANTRVFSDDQEDSVLEWWNRNQVWNNRFSTMREAREYLQALLAIDPFPVRITAQLIAVEGGYRVETINAEGRVVFGHVKKDHYGFWQLTSGEGKNLGRYRSLSHMRVMAPQRMRFL